MTLRPLPAYGGDDPYVFICYAHEDEDRVFPDVRWLQDEGVHVWWDEGISGGTHWRDEIAPRVRDSRLLVFFVSSASAASQVCREEVEYALAQGVPILSVYLEPATLPEGLELALSNRQSLLRHELDAEDYGRKVLGAVSKHLAHDAGFPKAAAPAHRPRPGRQPSAVVTAFVATVALVLGIVIGFSLLRPTGPPPATAEASPPRHLEVALGDGIRGVLISRDGSRFFGGGRLIQTRLLSGREWVPIAGTRDGTFPVPSPDGAWLAYRSERGIFRVPMAGGAPLELAELGEAVLGLAWLGNERILYSTNASAGVLSVSVNGGDAERVTTAPPGKQHWFPEPLPGGDLLVVERGAASGDRWVGVIAASNGEFVPLLAGSQARYLPSGHIVFYGGEGTLWAAAYDAAARRILGEAVPVFSSVVPGDDSDLWALWSLADDGTLVYAPGERQNQYVMVWVDREGREQALSAPPMAYRNLELSPTKDRVAVTVGQPGASDIWVYALDEDRLSRLTFEGGARATWMGDERLAFMRVVGESTVDNDLFTRRADGAGTVTRLTDDEAASAPSDFSSADDLVGTMNWDLAILASSPGQESRVLLATDSVELQPRVSPDGRWLAYVSNESGSYEVYVRPFPDVTSGRWQISRNGGGSPVWSADGSELFFISVDREMMAAPIADQGGSLVSGSPRALFDARAYPRWHFYFGPSVPEFDVSADGQRFLMIKPVQASQRTAHIVVNWLDELERLVPRP